MNIIKIVVFLKALQLKLYKSYIVYINKSKTLHIVCYLLISISLLTSACSSSSIYEYGVFLGIDNTEADLLQNYKLVVIEPSEFNKEDIDKLHKSGKQVYGYLNIGAIEEYRPYYKDFKDITLSVYENWGDERWVDVSDMTWQNFIIDELGKQYADMGFDGFFLDNADVYYHYPTDDIFNGLCNILKGLKEYDMTLIINGGDNFVSICMDKGISLFDGINQETVFTNIDFEHESYGIQDTRETLYFKDYLTRAKQYGLSVYLLEYAANEVLSDKIDAYCKEQGFIWYNAKSLELR